MTGILSALGQGYTEEDVLGYLMKHVPGMKKTISQAQRSGYRTKEILGFLSQNFESEPRRGKSESQIHAINERADAERAKYGLKTAATAVAAPIAATVAANALSRALPASLTRGTSPLTQTNVQSGLSALNPLNTASASTSQLPQGQNLAPTSTSQPPVNQPIVPQATQSLQPEIKPNKFNLKDLFSKHKILDKIEKLKEGNVSKEEIIDFIKQTAPYEMPNIEKETGQKSDQILSEYLQDYEPQKETPIEKNSTVISPQGVGQVLEVRNGKALIDVDGKKHQVDEDELETSPIPEKDMGELLDALNKQIEVETGEEVSRAINLVGFSPETRSVIVVYNSGDIYPYDDLDDEDIEIATNLQGMRRTSGNNYIGPWVEGTKSPAGSKMHDFVKSLQAKRGKGKEYTAKYKPLYHGHGPAHEKLKENRKKKKK